MVLLMCLGGPCTSCTSVTTLTLKTLLQKQLSIRAAAPVILFFFQVHLVGGRKLAYRGEYRVSIKTGADNNNVWNKFK